MLESEEFPSLFRTLKRVENAWRQAANAIGGSPTTEVLDDARRTAKLAYHRFNFLKQDLHPRPDLEVYAELRQSVPNFEQTFPGPGRFLAHLSAADEKYQEWEKRPPELGMHVPMRNSRGTSAGTGPSRLLDLFPPAPVWSAAVEGLSRSCTHSFSHIQGRSRHSNNPVVTISRAAAPPGRTMSGRACGRRAFEDTRDPWVGAADTDPTGCAPDDGRNSHLRRPRSPGPNGWKLYFRGFCAGRWLT